MSAVAGSVRPVNGRSSPQTSFNEAMEYEKILNLCQQISAGTHPRLKIPSQFVQGVPPPLPPALPTLAHPTLAAAATNDALRQLPGLQSSGSIHADSSKKPAGNVPTQPHSVQLKKGPSEIDPIFLQKSDHLIHAEMKIRRERLEKQLREQLDSQRNWAKRHPLPEDGKPDFDVAQTFLKATELVKPVPAKETRSNKSPSNSFDDDSLYSSKAPDSTPRGGDVIEESPRPGNQVQPIDIDDVDADGPVDHRNDVLHQTDHAVSSLRSNGRARPLANTIKNTSHDIPRVSHRDLDDSDDEPEYSPPEPTQFSENRRVNDAEVGNGYSNQKPPYIRNTDRYHTGRRQESPSADLRIVRNHITSPVAPKPSRISPLAMAKAPPQLQNRQSRQEPNYSRQPIDVESLRTSPETVPAPMQSRKRRKIREDGRRERHNKKRRGAISPEPNIKDEPVSPPPFHEVPPLGAARPQQPRELAYIEIDPFENHPAPERRVEYQQPRQSVYEVDSPSVSREIVSMPRSAVRESFRDDQDLRRVASMRNVGAEYPTERVQSVSHQQPAIYPYERQSSPVEAYRPVERRVAYEEGAPNYQRRLVRDPSPVPQPVGLHLDEVRPNELMPPPVRRIVVDEAGNRFYETIQPARAMPSTVPSGRRMEYERYNPGDPVQSQSVRAGSAFEEPYRERRYVQEMPPPQVTYRRVTEVPRAETLERGLYMGKDGERAPVTRSSSVQVHDFPVRQNTYFEERLAPREEIVRMASVRPQVPRYEEPREVIQRVQSVRPSGREVSVLVDDRGAARREYVTIPRPDYEVRRDVGGGYYEIDEGGRMVLERAGEGRQSVAPRY